jgi:hypothetical protein
MGMRVFKNEDIATKKITISTETRILREVRNDEA